MLPGDRSVRVDVGAAFHLLFRQRYIQAPDSPVRINYGEGRYEDLPSTEPAACFYCEVANGPCLIVEIEIIHCPNLAIRGADR